jgi:hypothetical protein
VNEVAQDGLQWWIFVNRVMDILILLQAQTLIAT